MALNTLPVVFTEAGKQYFANNGKLDVVEIGFGTEGYTPTGEETSLKNEVVRVPVASTRSFPDLNQRAFVGIIPGEVEAFDVREIGFYAPDGTLLFIWSNPERIYTSHVAGEINIVGLRVVIEGVDVSQIEVVETNPDLTLSFLPEFSSVALSITNLQLISQDLFEKIKSLQLNAENLNKGIAELQLKTEELEAESKELKSQTALVMFNNWQQYENVAEVTRQVLNSGFLAIRYASKDPVNKTPVTQNVDTKGDWSVIGLHSHPNYRDMMGMGMVSGVVNGYTFVTRHNDAILEERTGFNEYTTLSAVVKVNDSVDYSTAAPEQMLDLLDRYVKGQLTTDEKQLFQWDFVFAEFFFYRLGNINRPLADLFDSFRHSLPGWPITDLLSYSYTLRTIGKKSRLENNAIFPLFVTPGGDVYTLLYRITTKRIDDYAGKRWFEVVQRWNWWGDVTENDNSALARFKPLEKWHAVWQRVPGFDGPDANYPTWSCCGQYFSGANFGYYHHTYYIPLDAVNTGIYQNGYNDPSLFVAYSKKDPKILMRTTYALPVAFILRLPTENWNPNGELAVLNEKPTGSGTQSDPYNGIYVNAYWYNLDTAVLDPAYAAQVTVADTGVGQAYVRTVNGDVKPFASGGIRIVSVPFGNGVGPIRQVFPVYLDAADFSTFTAKAARELNVVRMDLIRNAAAVSNLAVQLQNVWQELTNVETDIIPEILQSIAGIQDALNTVIDKLTFIDQTTVYDRDVYNNNRFRLKGLIMYNQSENKYYLAKIENGQWVIEEINI